MDDDTARTDDEPQGDDPGWPATAGEPDAGLTVQLPDAEPRGDVLPVDLRDWVDFSKERATRVRVFGTEAMTQDLWCLEPQQATTVLRHAEADVAYTVVGGRAWFVTEQGEVGLDPLASLLVPAGVTHGIDNRGADPLIVLAVASPPADDDQPSEPLTTLARAVRPQDTTGTIGARLRQFLGS